VNEVPAILIVEDDHLIQTVVEEALREGGFEIAIASSAKQAIELLDGADGEYRALVTDINLGRDQVDGWEIARHAREIDPKFPVVYMSGTARRIGRRRAFRTASCCRNRLRRPNWSPPFPTYSTAVRLRPRRRHRGRAGLETAVTVQNGGRPHSFARLAVTWPWDEACCSGRLFASMTEHDMAGKSRKNPFDPQDFLAKVGAGKTISKYQKDQIIFSQGEAADAVFYVQKGRVKVVVLSDQGKEAVVGILEAGQFFGEGCLNGHDLRIATTTAMEECLLTAIGRSTMIAVLHDEPRFSELFVAYLLKRNSRIEEDLIDQLFNSSEKRLARLLLLLANFGKEGNPTPIKPNISQETLAEMIGTTRSRVSFFMNKFRKLGFISYNGKIEVHRSLLNAVLYEKPSLERE